MKLIFDFHENSFYYLLSSIQSSDPASIYNESLKLEAKTVFTCSEPLKSFLAANIALLSHYVFYRANKDDDFNKSFADFLSNFKDSEIIKERFSDISAELSELILFSNNAYSGIWDNFDKKEISSYFSTIYYDYIKEALSLFSELTGFRLQDDIEIHIIQYMPKLRGKNINYANKQGIAIAPPPANLQADYLSIIIHELAHHFSDLLLAEMGQLMPVENKGVAFERREACAEYLRFLFFQMLLINNEKLSLQNVPDYFVQYVNKRLKPWVNGIKYADLNRENKGSSQDNLLAFGRAEDAVYYFDVGGGRIFRIPIRYLSSANPLLPKNIYLKHFIKAEISDSQKKVTDDNIQRIKDIKQIDTIRFHLTEDCNLRCSYCYLSAGNKKNKISKALIAQAFSALFPTKIDECQIQFHGGGEPTLAFEEIKYIYETSLNYVHKPKYLLQTNGVFSQNVADWIVDKKIMVSVSLDGSLAINKKLRGTDENIFKQIIDNISYLLTNGIELQTLSVINSYSLNYLQETYEYIKSLGVRYMMFNPLHELGRAKVNSSNGATLDLMAFSKAFLELKKTALQDNVVLVSDFYSNITEGYNPRNYQCSSCKPGVNVHWNGDIVACTRAYELASKPKNPFVWANIRGGQLMVNEGHKAILQARVVENMKGDCGSCFLKYNCAGDCLVELYRENKDMYQPLAERCQAKKWFVKEYFKYLLDRCPKPKLVVGEAESSEVYLPVNEREEAKPTTNLQSI